MSLIIKELPLEEYIDALIGSKPYSVIDSRQAGYIRSSGPDHTNVCIVENEEHTLGYNNLTLGRLKDGLYRLWYKKDWEVSDNRRQTALRRNEELQQLYKGKVEQVVQLFIKMGSTEGAARQVVGMMTGDMLDASIANLQRKG